MILSMTGYGFNRAYGGDGRGGIYVCELTPSINVHSKDISGGKVTIWFFPDGSGDSIFDDAVELDMTPEWREQN